MSLTGQTEKNSQRAYVFRCSPNNGHLAVPPCELQTRVAHRNRSSNCRGLAFNYGASAVRWISHPPPAGSTISGHGLQNCARMNVASVFSQCGGRYLVGVLSFLPILKIGPVPTRGPPESTPFRHRASSVIPCLAPVRSARCSDTSCHRVQ